MPGIKTTAKLVLVPLSISQANTLINTYRTAAPSENSVLTVLCSMH